MCAMLQDRVAAESSTAATSTFTPPTTAISAASIATPCEPPALYTASFGPTLDAPTSPAPTIAAATLSATAVPPALAAASPPTGTRHFPALLSALLHSRNAKQRHTALLHELRARAARHGEAPDVWRPLRASAWS